MFHWCYGDDGVYWGSLVAGFRVQDAVSNAPDLWDTCQASFFKTELFRTLHPRLITKGQILEQHLCHL